MDIVTETLTVALENASAAHQSAIARRTELAADLAQQDALIELHLARVSALRAALPTPEPEA